jgi:hypothetical protein
MNKCEKNYLESNDSAKKQQQRLMRRSIRTQNLTALTLHCEFLLKVKTRVRIQNAESYWSGSNNTVYVTTERIPPSEPCEPHPIGGHLILVRLQQYQHGGPDNFCSGKTLRVFNLGLSIFCNYFPL